MRPRQGYVYYISDEYFEKVNDPNLMQNKRQGRGRPCYCCKKSQETGLYWMIPLSSQSHKFRDKYEQALSRYGKCSTLVLGQYAGKEAVFMIQNAFPVTEEYIVKEFTVKKEPLPVQCRLQRIIYQKFDRCCGIHKNGYKIFFTNIEKAKSVMIQTLRKS